MRDFCCRSFSAYRGRQARISAAATDARITPGEFVVDHPTLINLGFEWVIDGDSNRNARVDVSYRKKGDGSWKQGLPLMRLHGERIYQANVWNVVSPNMFAGSILDLEPDTEYEARFVMSRSGWDCRTGGQRGKNRDGPDAGRTQAGGWRQRVSRLSAAPTPASGCSLRSTA